MVCLTCWWRKFLAEVENAIIQGYEELDEMTKITTATQPQITMPETFEGTASSTSSTESSFEEDVSQPPPTTEQIAGKTVPVSTTLNTGQTTTEQIYAIWAPDVWSGVNPPRQVPVAPACQNIPPGAVCTGVEFKVKGGKVLSGTYIYYRNYQNQYFAWPTEMESQVGINEMNQLLWYGHKFSSYYPIPPSAIYQVGTQKVPTSTLLSQIAQTAATPSASVAEPPATSTVTSNSQQSLKISSLKKRIFH